MWKFMRGAAASIALTLVATLGLASSAGAVPVTYDVALTATHIDDPIAGISALPAGPFSGSFTLAGPLAANLNDSTVAPIAFDLMIGSASWDIADFALSRFTTDALGQITEFALFAINDELSLQIFQPAARGVVAWQAFDSCVISATASAIIDVNGSCILGDAGSVALNQRVDVVPEPATLALFGAGLAGLGWIARSRKAA